jgi:potassium/chloride transporter 9
MDEGHRKQFSSDFHVPSYGMVDISTDPRINGTMDNGGLASPASSPNFESFNCHSTGNGEIVETMSSTRLNGLSTFSGVFCPVSISMFSALLFLRLSFAVSQLGFFMTCAQLFLAYAIILLTVLSLCAVSSNGAIESGGVYYMISRSLGPEFGGSIGVLFFIANVFSCALYVSGFTEALTNIIGYGDSFGGKFIHCVLVSIVILCLCLLGSSIFAKTAVIGLFVIAVSYASFLVTIFVKRASDIEIPQDNTYFYMQLSNESDPFSEKITNFSETKYARYTSFNFKSFSENMFTNYTYDYTTGKSTDFAFMFSIIFSGVTGLMAGANVSGELARPHVSIPRGTLQAVFVTFMVYILTSFLLCLTCSRELLQNNYLVMVAIDLVPSLIFIGVFAATFFSSMSNLTGASRVLQRLAQDKLFGVLLAPATFETRTGNPIVSVIISWVCVVFVLMIGAMNRIAKITSIFFLLSYMGVNIACLALELTSAPNFRPNFKYFSSYTCTLGTIATIVMMLVIDASMSAVAIVILMLLIMILHYQAPIGSWGSISQALIYHQVRKYLLLLDVRKEHVKFWRPQILLLVNRPASCCPLMDFVNDLKKSGLYVIGHVNKGELDSEQSALDPLQQVYPYWLSLVDYLKIKAFVELTITENVRSGIQQLIRLSGLGAMKPNTVVIGFHEENASETVLQETHLLKDLKFSKIGRSEVVEYFTASDFLPKEMNVDQGRATSPEYIHILNDIMNLNKNLVIARHFNRFDRELMLKTGGKQYIDVWPSHLFKPEDNGLRWDNSSLFVLQLACILSMSSKWKSASLRVFICVNSLQDMHIQEQQLKILLQQLRIKAKSVMVPWDHVVAQMERTQASGSIAEFPKSFISAVNEMIRRNSADTAVTFLNLPVPPSPSLNKSDEYLEALRTLTTDLPPTLLVHGLSSVISTAL